MQITEVRIKLMEDASERLQAFCSITFDDCFVIRDLKIIEGANGPFVAMPSRKLTAHCPTCGCKNHLRAAHCNQCGGRLKEDRAPRDEDGRAKLYADIAHPINSACREMIQNSVVEAFHRELEESKRPGYVSRYDDIDVEDAPAQPPPTQVKGRASIPKELPDRIDSPAHDQTHIQPAQRPAGPHKARTPQPSPRPVPPAVPAPSAAAASTLQQQPAASPKKSDDFGAGIL